MTAHVLEVRDWVEPAGEGGDVCEVMAIEGDWKLCRWLTSRRTEWFKVVVLNRPRPPLLDCHLVHMPGKSAAMSYRDATLSYLFPLAREARREPCLTCV